MLKRYIFKFVVGVESDLVEKKTVGYGKREYEPISEEEREHDTLVIEVPVYAYSLEHAKRRLEEALVDSQRF